MRIYDFDECILLDNKNKNTVKIEPRYISASICMDGCSEVEIQGVLRTDDWRPNFHFEPARRKGRKVDYSKLYGAMFWEMPKIKDVKFNDPATIVFWADGTKTVVKCQDDDIFDPEKGLAMAITKKALGNKGNYCNELKKWLPKEEEEPTIVINPAVQTTAKAFAEAINRTTSAMKEAYKRK